ncbi:MAG: resolvase [Nitrososphaeraceae archaeon]
MGNIRRSRGYSYEYSIVNRINNRNWIAKRLGGSSVGLPDIIAVNNNKAILLVIEAKSGTGESLYVPSDQIERCFSIVKMFRYYNYKYVILAFKFLRKKRIKVNNELSYEKRKLVEYYKIIEPIWKKGKTPQIKCNYNGRTFLITSNGAIEINFSDYKMHFQKNRRHQIKYKYISINIKNESYQSKE